MDPIQDLIQQGPIQEHIHYLYTYHKKIIYYLETITISRGGFHVVISNGESHIVIPKRWQPHMVKSLKVGSII